MSIESLLRAGRARHLALMVESCTVKRVTGETLDPVTNKLTPTYSTQYSGACRVKPFRSGHPTESGQVSVQRRGYDVNLPVDGSDIQRGDVLTVTVSDDAALVGRPLTVTEVNYSGTSTARHIMVEDRA